LSSEQPLICTNLHDRLLQPWHCHHSCKSAHQPCLLCLFKTAKYSCTPIGGLSSRNRVAKGDQKRSLFVQHHGSLLALQAYPQIYKCVCSATDVLHKMCRRRPVNISNLASRITAGTCIPLSPLLPFTCLCCVIHAGVSSGFCLLQYDNPSCWYHT